MHHFVFKIENLKLKIRKGFTLVELLVVIAIIAILSVTAYVALGGQTGKARDSRRQSDISSIQSALELYFIANNNQYPDTLNGLTAKEMPEIPTDPWSGDAVYNYVYAPSGTNKQYQIAATLEGEEGVFEAYVIGNGTALLGAGITQEGLACPEIVDGGSCLPYTLQ